MNVKLVMAKGKARGHTIQLREATNVVGRQRECQVRIPSADVSRRHCVLTFEDGYLYVEDLGSTNGTFVNGERVVGKEVVQPDDMLEIGPATFTVKYDAPEGVAEALGAIPILDALEVVETPASEQTAQIDKRPHKGGTKPKPVEALDDLEVLEEVESVQTLEDVQILEEPPEESANPAFDIEGGSLHLPNNGDFRDLLSGLDGK